MTTEEVQKQVAAWRSRNRANLVDCPISHTISQQACRKRLERLQRIEHLRRGPDDGRWSSPDTCAACESLFEHDD